MDKSYEDFLEKFPLYNEDIEVQNYALTRCIIAFQVTLLCVNRIYRFYILQICATTLLIKHLFSQMQLWIYETFSKVEDCPTPKVGAHWHHLWSFFGTL